MANLSPAERLVVARRRAGLSQKKVWEACGMTRGSYQPIEAGHAVVPENPYLAAMVRSIESIEIHEACFLARQRSGMLLRELAKKIGYTKFWVGQMEHGRAKVQIDPIVNYWSQIWQS